MTTTDPAGKRALTPGEVKMLRAIGGIALGTLTWVCLETITLSRNQEVIKATAVRDADLLNRDYVKRQELREAISQVAAQFGREQRLVMEPIQRELEQIRQELKDARRD